MSITAIQLFMSEQIPTPLIFFSSMYSPWSSSAGEHGPPKQSFPTSATPASNGGTARLVAGLAAFLDSVHISPRREQLENAGVSSNKRVLKISGWVRFTAAMRRPSDSRLLGKHGWVFEVEQLSIDNNSLMRPIKNTKTFPTNITEAR